MAFSLIWCQHLKTSSQLCEVVVLVQSVHVMVQPHRTEGRPAQGQQHQTRDAQKPDQGAVVALVAALRVVLAPVQAVTDACTFLCGTSFTQDGQRNQV